MAGKQVGKQTIVAASATLPGLVTTGSQTFAGNKTLQGSLTITGVASGSTAIMIPDGSRIAFDGPTGIRLLYASGSNLVYVGGFSVGVQAVSCASVYPGGTAALNLRGRVTSTGSAIGIKMGAVNALATGDKILSLYSDDVTTEKANFDAAGTLTILGVNAASNAIVIPTNGRINFDGAGSLSSYIAWNGSTLITARAFAMPGCYTPIIYPNSASDLQIRGRMAAGGAAAGNIKLGSVNALNAGDRIVSFYRDSFTVEVLGVGRDGDLKTTANSFLDDSANTGNRTVNLPHGINAFAAGTAAVTITNSLVTATSRVFVVIQTNDATAVLKNVVPAAGSFTVNLTAATTGITKFGWEVVN